MEVFGRVSDNSCTYHNNTTSEKVLNLKIGEQNKFQYRFFNTLQYNIAFKFFFFLTISHYHVLVSAATDPGIYNSQSITVKL